jgi:periplasmic copper chaperone A
MFEIRSGRPLALAGLLLSACLSSADAHVILEGHEAPAYSYFKAQFLAGHGCDGAATTSIQVTIPEGVVGVKPMPKPGWTLTMANGPYAHPQKLFGKTVTSGVATVIWSGGPLPDAWSDEFTLMAQLPDQPAGTVLYFPVVQQCEGAVKHWDQIPGVAGAVPPLKNPAPALSLTPHAP